MPESFAKLRACPQQIYDMHIISLDVASHFLNGGSVSEGNFIEIDPVDTLHSPELFSRPTAVGGISWRDPSYIVPLK